MSSIKRPPSRASRVLRHHASIQPSVPLRRVAVSKLRAWRQDLFVLQSFTCKSQQKREPTSGLEPLTCSLRVSCSTS